MKRAIIVAACAVVSVAVSACASLDNLTASGGVGEKILTNLEGCHREYSGALGAGVTGSFRIICDPAPVKVASPPAAEPATPPGGT